jgi:hypothetical protein
MFVMPCYVCFRCICMSSEIFFEHPLHFLQLGSIHVTGTNNEVEGIKSKKML